MIFVFTTVLAALAVSVSGQGDPARYAPFNWCDDPSLSKLVGVGQECDAYSKAVYNQKVNVTLLYETLCPGCRDVITNVYPVLYPKFKDYATFEFVPYGNADRTSTGFSCQHGELECQLNQVETCAIHFIQNLDTRFQFILCIERLPDDVTPDAALKTCFQNASISDADQKSISGCWNSDQGRKLETAMADRTDNIWPVKHQWVPWVMINDASTNPGQNLLAGSDDQVAGLLAQQICGAYRGDQIPPICEAGLQTATKTRAERRNVFPNRAQRNCRK